MIAQLIAVAEVGAARLDRGEILETDVDGSLVVALASDGDVVEPLRCHMLQTCREGGDVVLVPRDTVLVWHTGRAGDWGVVLGRIGPTHAAPEPTAPEDVPGELVVEAARNLTLKCGEGSITIREDGRILIKGKDLVSHAQRTNRIRGGSVAIN